jgi:hypothetical protein
MRRGHWYRAAVCVALATLLRPTGVILVAPLLYEFIRFIIWRISLHSDRSPAFDRALAPRAAAVFAASPVGLGLFSAYCWESRGDPLAWLHIQTTYWNHSTHPIWQGIRNVAAHFLSYPIFSREQGRELVVDLLPLLFVCVLTITLARRQPLAFTLYLLGLLYMVVASPIVVGDPSLQYAIFDSAGRHMLPALPIYVALGRWARQFPRPFAVVLVVAIALQATLAVYFLFGGPII